MAVLSRVLADAGEHWGGRGVRAGKRPHMPARYCRAERLVATRVKGRIDAQTIAVPRYVQGVAGVWPGGTLASFLSFSLVGVTTSLSTDGRWWEGAGARASGDCVCRCACPVGVGIDLPEANHVSVRIAFSRHKESAWRQERNVVRCNSSAWFSSPCRRKPNRNGCSRLSSSRIGSPSRYAGTHDPLVDRRRLRERRRRRR